MAALAVSTDVAFRLQPAVGVTGAAVLRLVLTVIDADDTDDAAWEEDAWNAVAAAAAADDVDEVLRSIILNDER